jgi:hypothetical protein
VSGVEFIGVSLSVQCHPLMGSMIQQVDRPLPFVFVASISRCGCVETA